MKKIVSLVLAVLLSISLLSGCGVGDAFMEGFKEGLNEGYGAEDGESTKTTLSEDEENTEEDNDDATTTTTKKNKTTKKTTKKTTTSTSKKNTTTVKTTTKTSAPNTTTNQNNGEVELGTVSGKKYFNDFINVSCELPNTWVFYTKEQILKLNNLTADKMTDDEIAEHIRNASVIQDMYAINPQNNGNVNLNMEKLPDAYRGEDVDVKAVLQNQMPSIKQALEGLGATIDEMSLEKVKIDGKQYNCIHTELQVSGKKIYQRVVMFQRQNYLVCITATSNDADETDEILNYFNL